MERINQKIIECGAKEGASDADVQELIARNPPSTYAGKCTVACVVESGGMVSHFDRDHMNLSHMNFRF